MAGTNRLSRNAILYGTMPVKPGSAPDSDPLEELDNATQFDMEYDGTYSLA